MATFQTYGALRALMVSQHPDVSLDVIDAALQETLQEIDDSYPWTVLERTAVLALNAQEVRGTVIATKGLSDISLVPGDTGAIWLPWMNDALIQIGGHYRTYRITVMDPLTAKLDRPFEGEDTTGAGYWIRQYRVAIPPDFLRVTGVNGATLESPRYINEVDPLRMTSGSKVELAAWEGPYMILYPLPQVATSIEVAYTTERDIPPAPADAGTDHKARPIARHGLVGAGVHRLVALSKGQTGVSAMWERRFQALLADWQFVDATKGPNSQVITGPLEWPDHSVPPSMRASRRFTH